MPPGGANALMVGSLYSAVFIVCGKDVIAFEGKSHCGSPVVKSAVFGAVGGNIAIAHIGAIAGNIVIQVLSHPCLGAYFDGSVNLAAAIYGVVAGHSVGAAALCIAAALLLQASKGEHHGKHKGCR